VQYILAANNQNMNVRQSAFFAGETQNYMRGELSTPDRGVKQAGFYVLVGASGSMPAVLAEIGFISNPVEERFLAGSSGQTEIATALSDAVTEYFEDYSKRVAAAGTAAPAGGR
ncbi:MAG TPA: N-acetylmuramoyl-L-alanine amidase, partial [Gemmatimonadota bacterium]|nr:N-acetylmuramoyl-L-alanine amidase [Gemmatimonadota bacterium]